MDKDPLTYSDLLERYGEEVIPYTELLLTQEWSRRRKQILNRDEHTCTSCGTEPAPVLRRSASGNLILTLEPALQVHHHYYVLGKTPWDYPDDALSTLCEFCHDKYHQEQSVPVYKLQQWNSWRTLRRYRLRPKANEHAERRSFYRPSPAV